MSDDVDTRKEENAARNSEGPVGGERLAVARRALQISVLEIAKELHLDEPKVRALERNEFDVLGAPVFAKGHLRKYAQLVNVDPSDVMADYYTMNRSEGAPPVISTRPKPRKELSPGPWIAVIVVIVIAVSAYWWFTRVPAPPVEPSQEDLLPAESGQEVALPATDDGSTAEPEEIDTTPEVDVEPEEETTSPDIQAGQMRVLLTYSGECWTEISDASGRRLFFDLGKDGRTVELSGAEPFNVLFGNPGNVSVLVNGDDFALQPTAADRPLRLTISGT